MLAVPSLLPTNQLIITIIMHMSSCIVRSALNIVHAGLDIMLSEMDASQQRRSSCRVHQPEDSQQIGPQYVCRERNSDPDLEQRPAPVVRASTSMLVHCRILSHCSTKRLYLYHMFNF